MPNCIRDYNTMDRHRPCSPCLLLSSAGFGILIQHRKNPESLLSFPIRSVPFLIFLCVVKLIPLCICYVYGVVMVVMVWQLDLQLPIQSVPIITKVVSSSPVHGEVYSIQHYVIKFVSDLRQVGGFLRVLRFHSPIKLTTRI